MSEYNIAVIKGDGIGPEVINSAIDILDAIGKKYNHTFNYDNVYMGGCAIDKYGEPLPDKELKKCLDADSVLLGAVGGPKWDNVDSSIRPEKGLLKLRKSMDVYANLRPAKIIPVLKKSSPLKNDIIKDGVDIVVVRELTGGIYFGERGKTENEAFDVERYSIEEIKRIAKIGFEMAEKRNKKLVSVDKANVLESSRLWRSIVNEVAKDYPDVEVSHMYVDNMAMQIASNPSQFDVVVTSNMFGDIISDLLAAVCGSIGILESASIGNNKRGLYEPIHGSAPDIAGKNIANPIATILSAAMMLDISFNLKDEAEDIKSAIEKVLAKGYRTTDLYESNEDQKVIGTTQITDMIINEINKGEIK